MLQALGHTNNPIPEITDSQTVVQADSVMSGVMRCFSWSTTACTVKEALTLKHRYEYDKEVFFMEKIANFICLGSIYTVTFFFFTCAWTRKVTNGFVVQNKKKYIHFVPIFFWQFKTCASIHYTNMTGLCCWMYFYDVAISLCCLIIVC